MLIYRPSSPPYIPLSLDGSYLMIALFDATSPLTSRAVVEAMLLNSCWPPGNSVEGALGGHSNSLPSGTLSRLTGPR